MKPPNYTDFIIRSFLPPNKTEHLSENRENDIRYGLFKILAKDNLTIENGQKNLGLVNFSGRQFK